MLGGDAVDGIVSSTTLHFGPNRDQYQGDTNSDMCHFQDSNRHLFLSRSVPVKKQYYLCCVPQKHWSEIRCCDPWTEHLNGTHHLSCAPTHNDALHPICKFKLQWLCVSVHQNVVESVQHVVPKMLVFGPKWQSWITCRNRGKHRKTSQSKRNASLSSVDFIFQVLVDDWGLAHFSETDDFLSVVLKVPTLTRPNYVERFWARIVSALRSLTFWKQDDRRIWSRCGCLKCYAPYKEVAVGIYIKNVWYEVAWQIVVFFHNIEALKYLIDIIWSDGMWWHSKKWRILLLLTCHSGYAIIQDPIHSDYLYISSIRPYSSMTVVPHSVHYLPSSSISDRSIPWFRLFVQCIHSISAMLSPLFAFKTRPATHHHDTRFMFHHQQFYSISITIHCHQALSAKFMSSVTSQNAMKSKFPSTATTFQFSCSSNNWWRHWCHLHIAGSQCIAFKDDEEVHHHRIHSALQILKFNANFPRTEIHQIADHQRRCLIDCDLFVLHSKWRRTDSP